MLRNGNTTDKELIVEEHIDYQFVSEWLEMSVREEKEFPENPSNLYLHNLRLSHNEIHTRDSILCTGDNRQAEGQSRHRQTSSQNTNNKKNNWNNYRTDVESYCSEGKRERRTGWFVNLNIFNYLVLNCLWYLTILHFNQFIYENVLKSLILFFFMFTFFLFFSLIFLSWIHEHERHNVQTTWHRNTEWNPKNPIMQINLRRFTLYPVLLSESSTSTCYQRHWATGFRFMWIWEKKWAKRITWDEDKGQADLRWPRKRCGEWKNNNHGKMIIFL